MGPSVAALLSSEPPLCCLEWPFGVRPGTGRRVAVPQALLGLCWRPATLSSAALNTRRFPSLGPDPHLGCGLRWVPLV